MSTAEAKAFIEKVRPFDLLNGDELMRVAEQLTPGRFAPGEMILRRWANPSSLFVVADGVVEEADQTGPVALFSRGDSFDSMGLIHGRTEHSFVARNGSTCYLLPVQMFHALLPQQLPVPRSLPAGCRPAAGHARRRPAAA